LQDTNMISIIIVSFNTKDLTIGAIKSIISEGSKLEKEIIVIDNDSKDESVEYIKKLQKTNKNLVLIENKSNTGFSKANNQGIKIAKGEYVLLLNSDTIVKKGSIGKLYEFARKHKDAGVVGAKLLNIDGSLQASCFNFPTIKNAVKEYFMGEKGLFEKFAPKGNKFSTVDSIVGAAFLITPRALKEIGGLDERYFFYFEDIDYCRKVWRRGMKVYYYPGSEIVHYHGASLNKVVKQKKDQWKKLIPSSKVYHGVLGHYILYIIIWIGQKLNK